MHLIKPQWLTHSGECCSTATSFMELLTYAWDPADDLRASQAT